MIIRFAVENWRSFRNRAELDMTATRERQHSDRLSVSPALGVKLLPVTAIFGANASGKTKFVEALSFAQRFIVEGVPSNAQIAVRPFKLDVEMENRPSTFEFDLLINDLIYSFKFILSSSCVIEEILTVQNSYAAYEIYSRKANEPMTFGSRLLKDVDEGVLRVLEGGTRENMLFLTNAIGQKVKSPLLNALYSWFEKKLTVITPHSRYIQIQRLADQSDVMTDGILRLLKALDTGIDHLEEVVDHDFERKILAEQLQSIQN
ncbi:AAA family ATPase, partial [Sutterella wadsworthensis]